MKGIKKSMIRLFRGYRPGAGRGLNIGIKMTLYYLGLLFISTGLSGFLYYKIYASITAHKVSAISYQMIGSISANIHSLVENVNNYSKMVLSDPNVQDCLRKPRNEINFETQRGINKYLINMVETIPLITAIYIFDNHENRYGADKFTVKTGRIGSIAQAQWYSRALEAKGGFILRLNAGEIFNEPVSQETYVSLIRVINDLNTQQPIGILIMNISKQAMLKSFAGVDRKYFTDLVVKNETNRDILRINGPAPFKIPQALSARLQAYEFRTHRFQGKWYLLSQMAISPLKWKIVSIMPLEELARESRVFTLITFAMILLNGLLLFLGFIVISKSITVPIHKLLQSMKEVEQGRFNIAEFKTADDEIGKLKEGFNIMVREIRNLIERTVVEQRKMRQTELDVLQAQIKPHFLYNTFDAISSLALSGRSHEVYTIIKALGSYYRTSLSKGNPVITIGAEIEIVENYLTIQQIRYGDLFTAVYDVDQSVTRYKIQKLILQPLVENAIYHGIRPKGEPGTITVTAKRYPDRIELSVADDGVGMGQNVISRLMSAQSGEALSGFGLRGTIERLRIFYGVPDILTITSEAGKGVTVKIHIPLQGVVMDG
jgi:two-component system sensor histidine kinase YesM